MKQIYIFDIPNVVIGSRTVEEYSFQVCNFMNMLQNYIHYSDDKEVFSTGQTMTIGVVNANLMSFIKDLEKMVENKSYYNCKHKEMIITITSLLTVVLEENNTVEADAKQTKLECDKLWDVCYDYLKKRFPLIKQYTYIKNEKQD